MKVVAEFLADALNFDRLADAERIDAVRAVLRKQAAAYREHAIRRAKQLGSAQPDIPSD